MNVQTPNNPFKPRSIRRVFVVFLLLMLSTQLLMPCCVKYYYNRAAGYYSMGKRLSKGFELIHLELPNALAYIQKHRSDYDCNVIVLGDSVVYGNTVSAGESIPAYLEQDLKLLLPGKKVRVWNLAIPGSKPGDIYYTLRRIEPLQPDAVVLDFNIISYSRLDSPKPVAFPWLYLDDGLPADAVKVVDKYQQKSTADRIAEFVDKIWPLYHYREFLNALLFQGHPRKQLEQALSSCFHRLSRTPEAPGKPDKAALRDSVAYMYDAYPVDPQTNNGYRMSAVLLDYLKEKDEPAVVFLTDQNADILGDLLTNNVYRQKAQAIDRLLRESGRPYLNFTGKIPLNDFADNVHLNPDGNRLVAGQLAASLAPQLGGGVK